MRTKTLKFQSFCPLVKNHAHAFICAAAYFYVENTACDVSKITARTPCRASAIQESHVCRGLCDSILDTFVRFIFLLFYSTAAIRPILLC